MFAVEFIKIAVIGRVMLGTVPPVPIAALRDQDFFERQLSLGLAGGSRMLRIEFARVVQVVPGPIVLGSADPDIEVRIDPGTRNQRSQWRNLAMAGDCLGDSDCL